MSAPITILNSAIWLTVCLILNWILYRKLRKIKLSQRFKKKHFRFEELFFQHISIEPSRKKQKN